MKSDFHTKSVSARFSASADTYNEFAIIQIAAAQKVADMVRKLGPPSRILDIGCGSGILTEMTAEVFPGSRIDAIDIAPKLLAVARRRFKRNDRVTCVIEDARLMVAYEPYSLIVSSSSIHWITPLDILFDNLLNITQPKAHIAFSMMVYGTLGELHAARARVAPQKGVEKMPAVIDVIKALDRNGFNIELQETESVKVHYKSAKAFIQSIHNLGVTGGRVSTTGKLLTRGELNRLIEDYDENYSDNGGVYATYELLRVMAVRR